MTSISRTTRVRFDGRGTLTYASEVSFSGPSGMAGSRSGKKSGLYRVVGNNILLVFPDGSGDMARIHLRQTSGRITEVKFRGKLYATGLCK